jgi:exodeoxyribonuclease-5
MAKIRKVSNVHEQHGFRFADITLEFMDTQNQEPITCRVILDSLYTDSPNLPYEEQKKLYEAVALDYEDIFLKQDRLEAIKKDPYYNALQIKFAFAITCHKAQGGQWPAVFVDQGYLTDEMLTTEFLRWLYTGITRATEELFLVNFNEKFYS